MTPTTPAEAKTALQALYQEAGLPEHVPFGGNVWERTTASLVALRKRDGPDRTRSLFEDALAALEVLAAT